jgi:hydroxymethylglutaryl-CoA lyase
MFERRGLRTGIDLDLVVAAARQAASLPGGTAGGRVRDSLASRGEAFMALAAT